ERDVAEQGDERIAQIRFGRPYVGGRRLERTTLTAEKIELPTGIEARAVDFVAIAGDHALLGIDEAGVRLRACRARGGADRRKKRSGGDAAACPRLDDARAGLLERLVVGNRALDQIRQQRIVECGPPLR